MEQLIESTKSIMNGLNDLTQLMADEDPGAEYVKRLAREMDQLFVQVILESEKQTIRPKAVS